MTDANVLGFIGLGVMGESMCRNLAKKSGARVCLRLQRPSRTAPVALALFPGIFEVPWGDIAAASILASLPPILLVAVLQRYLIRGLLAGALRE